MEKTKVGRNNKGITLVALVVTIVVLLILAGITIMYVMGENSVFKQAGEAKLNTELAKIEEQASLIYTDKLLQKAQNNNNLKEKPTMQEIVGELRNKGYEIEQVAASGNEITGISLDKENMTIGFGKNKTIQVTFEGNSEPYTYFAKIDGKYYKMHLNGGVVTIDRTESDISGSGDSIGAALSVSSEDETIATATIDSNTNIVTVTATDKAGTAAITVTYGEYMKVCNVKVIEAIAETLEINSVRARIATGYTRWIAATAMPEGASQEFEWISSNQSVATVDNKGVITAKQKGTTTITVKTIDGSNLSKKCTVTIDDAVAVTTLTDFQTKNIVAKDENGNLITVPGDFKVLTSEGTKVTQGMVIQDREGNEFVWVPVDSVSTGSTKPADDIRLGRYTFDSTNGTPKKEQDADNYTQKVDIRQTGENYNFYEMVDSTGLENRIAKNLESFVTMTNFNGGYYIARYEASKGTDEKVDSQNDKNVWEWIAQNDAAIAAREMYDSNYIESDLVNSYSWDTAIVFIQQYSGNSNYSNAIREMASGVNTGKSGNKVLNIYDMSSNYREWTTEQSDNTDYPFAWRGGTYEDKVNTGSRNKFRVLVGWWNYSFRPILYLK